VKLEFSQHRRVEPELGVHRAGRGHHQQQRLVLRQQPVVRDRDEPAGVKNHLLLYRERERERELYFSDIVFIVYI
jgi:hypothetical protein